MDGCGKPVFLHEAHVSCVVAGTDESRWVAYCFLDTYFEEDGVREDVTSYHERRKGGENPDPLTYGYLDADHPPWDPRQYFLIVLSIQLRVTGREWERLVQEVERGLLRHLCVSRSLAPDERPRSFENTWSSSDMIYWRVYLLVIY